MIQYQSAEAGIERDAVWFTKLSVGAALLAITIFFEAGVHIRAGDRVALSDVARAVIGCLAALEPYTLSYLPIAIWLVTTRSQSDLNRRPFDATCLTLRVVSIANLVRHPAISTLRPIISYTAQIWIGYLLMMVIFLLLIFRMRSLAQQLESRELSAHSLASITSVMAGIVLAEVIPEAQRDIVAMQKLPRPPDSLSLLVLLAACVYASVIFARFATAFHRDAISTMPATRKE